MTATTYESTTSYKVIYVFSVPYEDHAGLLKIGETKLVTAASPAQLPPDCPMLVDAAHRRIARETKTANVKYDLLYAELAVRKVRLNDGSVRDDTFGDRDVHHVLQRSGIHGIVFEDTGRKSEWYPVSLQTAKNAIRAVKEGRAFLTEAERAAAGAGETQADGQEEPVIVLRDEQREAVERAKTAFRTKGCMLWDCKMRFGKTISACTLVKECGFQKAIVVTHRPVVADGWRKDYDLVFGKDSGHVFRTKIKGGREADFDESIDAENARELRNLAQSGTPFMYFASMQDLRESDAVKPGGYRKNAAVFGMDWDIVIYDEAHEGTQTDLGQKVQELLEKPKHGKAPKMLSLSGTPYNILGKHEDSVYSWDYVMEQKRKREWAELYPEAVNPYEDMPELRIMTFDLRKGIPDSYVYETKDMAFSFAEFFRVWTGDPKRDFRRRPEGAEIGSFVHEQDVKTFLNLIAADSEDSGYPFSTHERRKAFKHTFWIVPGVREAAALSRLLQRHPVFMHYALANVAGAGDQEEPFDDALKKVRSTIQNNEYTITISCGRLTTGVTVPEWTAVMLLTGSANTEAKQYMQTIFRVQSAGSIDGKQKTTCYAFDFAPDRTIKVLSEVHARRNEHTGAGGETAAKAALGEFLNFCPVLAVEGTRMVPYDVPKLMRQIKRLSVEKAIRNGFDDESVYRRETGIVMDEADEAVLARLETVLSRQKQTKIQKSITISSSGLTGEEFRKAEKAKSRPPHQRTPEEEELLKKAQEQKKARDAVIQLLRNVSIRLPMLIYGADIDFEKAVGMKDFVDLVDDESWAEFLPRGVTKELFLQLVKYYDEDVVVGAGFKIRRLAKAADELPPLRRAMRIAEIFSMFRNPDKETVLTPWRVVNLHISDTLGGWCFFDSSFKSPDGLLDVPRKVVQSRSTAATFSPSAKILEMNSKSGLYPLYMACGIYASKIGGREDAFSLEEARMLWQETLEGSVFVLCRTEMARSITRRTLAGYRDYAVNAIHLPGLLEQMADGMSELARKLKSPATWGKQEEEAMKFDAVVGNPPYQKMDGGSKASAVPLYHHFVRLAKEIAPDFISMIIPARWYSGGRGLDSFRTEMMADRRIMKMIDYADSRELFSAVDIAGGICYFLWSRDWNGKCLVRNINAKGISETERFLDDHEIVVRSNDAISILEKIKQAAYPPFSQIVSHRRPFGLRTYAMPDETGECRLRWSGGIGPLKPERITAGFEMVDRWKVMISYLTAEHAGQPNREGMFRVLSTNEILPPKTVCTETYLIAGHFGGEEQARRCLDYLKTRFARFLILQAAISQHVSQSSFKFVPLVDFARTWTDEELYRTFSLSDEEVRLIEGIIKPMH